MSRVYPRDYGELYAEEIDLLDDDPIYFGTDKPSSIRWETADPNANVLLFALPAGGLVDVPVAVFGEDGIVDKDLTFFNGITQPLIAVVDADEDSWVGLGFTADDAPMIKFGGLATGLILGLGSLPAPDSLLHLWKATSGASAPSTTYPAILTIESDDDAYIYLFVPNTKLSGIAFSNPAMSSVNSAGAIIYYDYTNRRIRFTQAGEELATYLTANGFADLQLKRTARAASATLGDEGICGVTDTSAPRTITLPTAKIAAAGKLYLIKDESGGAGSNAITLVAQSGETIDGAASVTISSNYGGIWVYTDGTNWFIA